MIILDSNGHKAMVLTLSHVSSTTSLQSKKNPQFATQVNIVNHTNKVIFAQANTKTTK